MRNVSTKLMNSWVTVLNGNLSNSVPVYVLTVPPDAPDNYVWIYVESETDVEKNSTKWVKSVDLICQVVTTFNIAINPDEADAIANEIGVLVADGPHHNHNLPAQSGITILTVTDEQTANLQEDDGTNKIYRKVIRYNHLITINL